MAIEPLYTNLAQARDAFYACLEQQQAPFSPGDSVPTPCRRQRAAYEKACLQSWVKHFDTLRDKEVRFLQTLHRNINSSASTATGGLSGKAS